MNSNIVILIFIYQLLIFFLFTKIVNFFFTGSAIRWLKENFQITIDINSCQNLSDLIFIPAFCGLCSPFWNHNARGIIMGLSTNSTRRDIAVAAYDAIGYQTYEILQAVKKDCKFWSPIEKLIVGGDFSENTILLQVLADLCGIEIGLY